MSVPPAMMAIDPIGGLAHLIQSALTPVFLLSGIATLLQMFNSRLGRVADHLAQAAELLRTGCDHMDHKTLRRQLRRFTNRMWLLDACIALGAIGGAATCGAAFALFLGGVRNSSVDSWLISLFAIALACTVGSLVVFMGDSVIAWLGLRREGPLPKSAGPAFRGGDLPNRSGPGPYQTKGTGPETGTIVRDGSS